MRNTGNSGAPPVPLFAACALFCGLLGGCSTGAYSTGQMMVAPGKFVLYSCPELARRAQENAGRERKLRDLIAKAETGRGGHLVSSLTYRPDYDRLMEESRQLREMAVEKNCKTAPAAGTPSGAATRANDKTPR